MKSMKPKRTEEGLTLLESLVGIMVIAIVVTALTPPMLIAFASRVQNYRASQAMKIAQGEIDRVRLLVDKGNYDSATMLPQFPPRSQLTQQNLKSLLDIGPPQGKNPTGPCPRLNVQADTVTSWCSVDINNDGNWDLGVQTFRSFNPPNIEKAVSYNNTRDIPIAFWMGVRVYTRAALTASPSYLKVRPAQDTMPLGLTAGEGLSLPLVNRYIPIVRSDLDISGPAYNELMQKLRLDQP